MQPKSMSRRESRWVSSLSLKPDFTGCRPDLARWAAPGLLCLGLLAGCAAPPAPPPASGSGDSALQAAAFADCKRDAATRNLPLAQHQEALFECARRHAGKAGESCLGQLILSKTRVHELEGGMAHCLRVMPK